MGRGADENLDKLNDALLALARKLETRRIGRAAYDAEVDRLLGTGLPERDRARDAAWERARRRLT